MPAAQRTLRRVREIWEASQLRIGTKWGAASLEGTRLIVFTQLQAAQAFPARVAREFT